MTLLFTFISLFFSEYVCAQNDDEYEEIIATARVQGIGTTDLNPLYGYGSGQLLLPITEFFQFLGLKVEPNPSMDSISGFIVDESKHYLIDNINKQVSFNGQTYHLKQNELIKTEMGLYMDYSLFGKVFGLYCSFNFRNLSVEVKPDFELPAIREIRLRQFRKNVQHLKGEVEVDTTINREYHLLKFGMVDWSVSATQNKSQYNDTRAILSTGGELLGGETNVLLNYSSRYGFNDRSQQYYWRWANNQKKIIRQVRLGKIGPASVSSIYDPVVGITATNARTTYRRSFGEYTISDYTEPGWTVELYVNNVIVDYKTADASGFYSFDVPLVYGTSQVMLKFYGPYGEERIKEQDLNIPFNFLPPGEVEYTLSSGYVMDGDDSRFGRADVKYGVNRFFTVGGGIEYLSSIATGNKIPFLTFSVTPFRNFLITGEYADGVRSKALLNYRIPSGLILELDYTKYVEGQEAIRLNYLEERKASLSIPMRFSSFSSYTRLGFNQNVYEALKYNTANVTFSSFLGKVSANISAYANWLSGSDPYIYGNWGMGIRMSHGFTLRPQGQVDITNKRITSVKAEIEKRVSRSGYLAIAGEENFRSSYRSLNFSFRWDLPFAQVNGSSRISPNDYSFTQGAQGSLAFGSGDGRIVTDNRSTIGLGGVIITPFVDINHNGTKDKGEPIAPGLDVKMSGGRTLSGTQDSTIRIMGLEPYTSYVLALNDKGLEEISWRLKNKDIRVYIDPNQFKRIDVPVLPMGEVNGWVYIKNSRETRGQGRILVNFFNQKGELVAKTLTERDGGFTFLGLPPGDYYAQIDETQLERLKMTADEAKINFTIKPMYYGDIVYDLQFVLQRVPDDNR